VIDCVAEAMPHGMHNSTICHEGPVPLALDALAAARPAGEVWPGDEPARVRADLAQAFAPHADRLWGPHQVFAIMREVTPPATVAGAMARPRAC
jgi:acetolactate synthase I/II/III large subunit